MAGQIEHIDREKLFTDVYYRFQYVCKFANFGEADIAALKSAAPLVAPAVPSIVDAVYQKLFSYDITKAVFLERNDGFEGKLASDLGGLTVENEQIKFRKNFLGKYLVRLVTADYDEKFVRYLDWVGRIHTDTPEKKSKINVDYVHCNALFAYVHGHLAELIDSHPQLQDNQKLRTAVLAAFSKLLWIQNDLFARHYVREGEEYRKQPVAAASGITVATRAVTNPLTAWAITGAVLVAASVGVLTNKN